MTKYMITAIDFGEGIQTTFALYVTLYVALCLCPPHVV